MPLSSVMGKQKQQESERVGKEVSNLTSRLGSIGAEIPGKDPGLLYKILETVARPGYMASNFLQEFMNPQGGTTPDEFDPFQAAWRGLSLQEKTTGKDILSGMGVSEDPLFEFNLGPVKVSPSPAGLLGFGMDVINPLDPINWLTFGTGKAITKGGAAGYKALSKSFGEDTAQYLVEKFGDEAVEGLSAPSVGKLVEKIMKSSEKLGIQEGINPAEIAERLSGGLRETGSKAGTKLLPDARKHLTAKLQVPIINKQLGSVPIPGTGIAGSVIGNLGKMFKGNPLYEAGGRAFSTDFVPSTVPDNVWTKFIRGMAPNEVGGDLGYHAGDLGKAENLFSQMSSRRSTGQFGTGTYFVGNPDEVSEYLKKGRPLKEVDFSQYHLFRPSSAQQGLELHEFLKDVNNYAFGRDVDLEDLLQEARKIFGDTDFTFELTKLREYALKHEGLLTKNYQEMQKLDSPSTIFMKDLGYNGIDVRGLKGLDDTQYGSVIYDLSKKKPPKVELEQVSGTEAYTEMRTGLQKMMDKSRIKEQRFMGEVEAIFKGLNADQRKKVLQSAIYPDQITPDIQEAVNSFTNWRQQVIDTYKQLGVEFTPLEAYAPFVAMGKPLSKDEMSLLKGIFGTGIRQVQSSDIVQMISKYDPHLIRRTTNALDPAEVNRVLGREWLTEDAAIAMSRRGIRSIRGEEATTFLHGMAKKYGLKIDDIAKIRHLPEGYVIVRTGADSSGRVLLNAAEDMTGDAIALPQEFVKAYNDYTDLMFNTVASTAFGRLWDDGTRIYKTMAYMWNPGHIPRDFASNMYNLWLMDVRSPMPMVKATQVLLDKDTMLNFKGWQGTGSQLLTLSEDLGLMDSGSVLAEFLQAGNDFSFRFGGKYTDFMRKWTRNTDNYSRLVGLLDRLAKGDTPEQAVAQVKKYLFDYFDLTPFEKKWMKRVIPFYTWMRKNIPLQVQTLLSKPGKYAATYETMRDVGEIPDPREVPDFITKSGGFNLPGEGGGISMIPNLPFSDIGQIPTNLGDLRSLLGMLNPALRAPIEMMTNTALYSGQPIERYPGEPTTLPLAEIIQQLTGITLPQIPARTAGYALDQIPPLRNLSVVANPEHPRQGARLASILGGPQIYPADWAQGAATYEERDMLRALVRKLEDLGMEVPSVRELEKKGKKGRGLAGVLRK